MTSPLISHTCRFDGQRNWIRLEFGRPVEVRVEDRRAINERQVACENEVRVNGRRGGTVYWYPFNRDSKPETARFSGHTLESGSPFDVEVPLRWGWMNLVDGTYLIPEDAQLPVRLSKPGEVELRVWKFDAEQLARVRRRDARSGPVSHGAEPERRLSLNWTEQNRWLDLREAVRSLRGLLYLELWSAGEWLDAGWVDTTGLGLSMFETGRRSLVLAWELSTGRGTDSCGELPGGDGVFLLDRTPRLLKLSPGNDHDWAVFECEGREVCLPWVTPSNRSIPNQVLRVFTDRERYQKGETVGFCGWFRSRSGLTGPFEQSPAARLHYAITYRDYHRHDGLRAGPRGVLTPTAQGGFHGTFQVEAASDSEHLQLEVAATDPEGYKTLHSASVNHRKIEYPETGCRLRLEEGQVRFQAYYATGEPLKDLEVSLNITVETPLFQPLFFPAYQFHHQENSHFPVGPNYRADGSPPQRSEQTVRTDPQGSFCLELPAVEASNGRARRWDVQARYTSPEGRTTGVGDRLREEPRQGLFVGLRWWGETVRIVVSDAEGIQVSGCRLRVWAEDIEPQEFTTTGEPISYHWPREKFGRLYAEARDPGGDSSISSVVRPATLTGPCQTRPFVPSLFARLDKPEWEEGETVFLSLFHDGGPAFAVVDVYNNELLHRETRRLEQNNSVWEFYLDQRFVGRCHVHVELNTRHGRRSFDTEFRVTPTRYQLEVNVACRDSSVAHGETTLVNLSVRTPQGLKAEGADVMLFVVDKAGLRASGNGLLDPIHSFYDSARPTFTGSSSLDRSIHRPEPAPQQGRVCVSHAPGPSPPVPERVSYREAGEPLVYSGAHSTDANGEVSVEIEMTGAPDDYAVIALAAHNWSDFGRGESNLICQQPAFTLRMKHPDFLWRGDFFRLAVRTQNFRARAEQVQICLRASNLLPEQTGIRMTVPGSDTGLHIVTFESPKAGPAGVQVALTGENASDRFQFQLPVFDPRIPRNWSDRGMLSSEAPVQIPLGVTWATELRLEVWAENPHLRLFRTLSENDNLQAALQRVIAYLWIGDYRRQVFEERQARQPGVQPLPELETSLRSLLSFQSEDGGFFHDQRDPQNKVDFYFTLFACRALWEASRRGLDVPEARLATSLDYLRSQIDTEYDRATQCTPNPWRPFHSDMLEDMGLPGKRRHPLQHATVFPTCQFQQLVSSEGTQGGWTLIEARTDKRPSLSGFMEHARQLHTTPYQDPRGVFRFGTAGTRLGELGLSGDETKATRWSLPTDLEHLILELEGEGRLFYRLTASGLEPTEPRTPGYGPLSRTVNRQPPDENGEWWVKVGSWVEVCVELQLMEIPRGLECCLPKPAGCMDNSEKQILGSDRGYGGFRFRLEARHKGRFVFPPAWVRTPSDGVIARTDWHTLVIE